MTLLMIVFRSLRQHMLSTVITSLSIALAGGLILSVWVIKDQSNAAFTDVNSGFDAVLGARSSKLQLVLNSIFHVEASPGNLAWEDYEDIRKHPGVANAIPIAVGDNYRGFRLVGVTPDLFTETEYREGKRYTLQPNGRWIDPTRREAVVGGFAAAQLGLNVGDTFHPYHGLLFDEEKQHAETYVVVGIMELSNTPADRVIWIPLAGLQKMSGHDPKTASDVSAVLIKLRNPQAGFRLDMMYNKQGNRLTLAWPIDQIMAQLFRKISWFDKVLEMIAYLVALVAAGSVLAGIYNSMNERKRDIAILRALGARRRVIFGAIVMESTSISVLGMILAFGVYGTIFSMAAAIIRVQTGVVLNPAEWHNALLWTPIGMIGLGALTGCIPAFKAYRTQVAENLLPVS
ncbi:MAG: ABC transporter permease [Verrucomicrobia bacterium]|jgi:putative ABC transport system permease protein|nr:ABC transporter permease [Verrucomicrobiota bacterium]